MKLKELKKYSYDRTNGIILKDGKPCAYDHKAPNTTYRMVRLSDGTRIREHVLIAIEEGIHEDGKVIDHIDGNGSNNHISNLRCITQAENRTNNKMNKRNTSGIPGIAWNEKNQAYQAYIGSGKNRQTKQSKDLLACISWRLQKEQELGYINR